MNNVVIHVGLRKTATTWLQDTLFSSIKDINYIAKNNANYPEWLIKWHYLDDYAFKEETKSIQDSFTTLLDVNKLNVLSSEAFTNTSVIYSQADRIKKIVPTAKIIITLRDPIDVIKSHYLLDIQDGINFLELDKYLDWERTPFDLFKRKPIYLPDFFYDENIKYYRTLFGKENILILKFEDMRGNPEQYINNIADFLDVKLDYRTFRLNVKRNESNRNSLADVKYNNFKSYLKNNMNISIENINFKKDDLNFTDTIMSKALEEKLKKYFKGKCFGYY